MAFPAPARTFIAVIHEREFTFSSALGACQTKHVLLVLSPGTATCPLTGTIVPDYTILS
jgi:hypothetical protein